MKRILSLALVCVLLLGCVFALASCGGPNKDPEKAVKALEDAEYQVMDMTKDGIGVVAAMNGDDVVYIYYCENADDAKEAYDEAKEGLEELGEEAEGYKVGKSGKVVYMGTKAAIKAAK